MMDLLIVVLALIVLAIAGLVLFSWRTARRVEQVLPPRGKFIDVDGNRLHYLDVGQGPVIVMIHGLGGQAGHFTFALVDRLKQDFRVVVIERPGSGYSTRPRGASARLRAQGKVIAKAIKALDLGKPLLMGHSMGGAVSLAIAIDHPECVGGLALITPLTHPVETPPEPFEALAIQSDFKRWLVAWTFAVPMSIRNGPKLLAEVFAPEPAPVDFPLKAGGLLSLRPSAFEAASLDMVQANDDLPDMVKCYPTLAMPVSMLYATEDNVLDYRVHGTAMKAEFPALDLQLTSGGHMLPLTAPDKTADFVRRASQRITVAESRAAE